MEFSMTEDTKSINAAHFWIGRNFLPVPVNAVSKRPYNSDDPGGRHREALRITAKTAAHYFSSARQNIGVLLGDKYGSADVDCDCLEAITAAHELLPETGMIFGRQSKPSSHFFYRYRLLLTLYLLIHGVFLKVLS